MAREVVQYLAGEEIQCKGIIVSDNKRHFEYLLRLKVFEFSEIEYDDSMGIILTLAPSSRLEVLKQIKAKGMPKLDNIYAPEWHKEPNSCNRSEEPLYKGYFKNYTALDNLGQKYGTDKHSSYHNYLNKYDFFLSNLKDKEMNVLELGVFKGASIAMWEEYFPHATIYGVDIDEECKIYEGGRKRILIEDLFYEERIKK